jgi:hypothetical protein
VQTCSRCHTLSSDNALECSQCQAELSLFSTTALALQKFQANTRVLYVRIMVNDDCCPVCRSLEGAYPKDSVPPLPVDGCSSPNGCRCFYQPFLDEIYP